MKKILLIVGVMLVFILLAGCSQVKDVIDDDDKETHCQSGILVNHDYIKPSLGISERLTILFDDGNALEFNSGKLSEFNLFCQAHYNEVITVWHKHTTVFGNKLLDFKTGEYEE